MASLAPAWGFIQYTEKTPLQHFIKLQWGKILKLEWKLDCCWSGIFNVFDGCKQPLCTTVKYIKYEIFKLHLPWIFHFRSSMQWTEIFTLHLIHRDYNMLERNIFGHDLELFKNRVENIPNFIWFNFGLFWLINGWSNYFVLLLNKLVLARPFQTSCNSLKWLINNQNLVSFTNN